jgi:hypothetical protein
MDKDNARDDGSMNETCIGDMNTMRILILIYRSLAYTVAG